MIEKLKKMVNSSCKSDTTSPQHFINGFTYSRGVSSCDIGLVFEDKEKRREECNEGRAVGA